MYGNRFPSDRKPKVKRSKVSVALVSPKFPLELFRVRRSRCPAPPRQPRASGMRMLSALSGRAGKRLPRKPHHITTQLSSNARRAPHARQRTCFLRPLPSRPAAVNPRLFPESPEIDGDISGMQAPCLRGRKALCSRAGPSSAGVLSQRTKYNVARLRYVAKITQPNCPRRCCKRLSARQSAGTAQLSATCPQERRMQNR